MWGAVCTHTPDWLLSMGGSIVHMGVLTTQDRIVLVFTFECSSVKWKELLRLVCKPQPTVCTSWETELVECCPSFPFLFIGRREKPSQDGHCWTILIHTICGHFPNLVACIGSVGARYPFSDLLISSLRHAKWLTFQKMGKGTSPSSPEGDKKKGQCVKRKNGLKFSGWKETALNSD